MSALAIVAATLVTLAAAGEADEIHELQSPRVLHVWPQVLERTKARIAAGEKTLEPALDALRHEADAALSVGPFSVMQKTGLAASGDKHDYYSLAPYYWPDPQKPDGRPYVGRDGQVNPECVRGTDRLAMNRMAAAVQTLTLAWSLTGEARYAQRAALLLDAWFLDPATRMNPHLAYGQAIPGRTPGRAIGIIETRVLIEVVDAARLLESSPAWTTAQRGGFSAWCAAYLDWLRTSKLGPQEEAAPNNHGTWYDAQVVALALQIDQQDLARQVLEAAKSRRLAAHVEPDGRQPLELARTRSFFYTLVNLRALCVLAELGQRVGVDLWHTRTADGRSLQAAIDYVAPYADPQRAWPHRELRLERDPLLPLLQQAAAIYHQPRYRQAIEFFPAEQLRTSRGRLLYAAEKP